MKSSLEVPQELIGLSGLYNSPDPLLRRLRLEDPSGQSITDVEKYFEGRDVLVLYAGSEQGSHNLKALHRDLTTLALKQYKASAIIYVSTDTDPAAPKRLLANLPWLRMTFNDNSDFAPMVSYRESPKIVEIEDVERGEDFIQAGEIEVGAESVEFGKEEYKHEYVRPLSRAATTALMSAYSTPSLAIYHIPSHRIIAKNVRQSVFSPANINKNFHTWRNGGTPSMRIVDITYRMRWSIAGLILVTLYRLLIAYGGEEYNVLPRLIESLNWRSNPAFKGEGS